MRRVLSLIFVFTCGLSLAYPRAQSKAPAPAPPEKQEPPVLSVPPGYKYESSGRRDPFVNPIPKPQPGPVGPGPTVQRPPGLKGVLVSETALAGVVTSREPSMNVAVIKAPGNKTYFARVGDALFDGVVKDIRLGSVTFVVTAAGDAKQETPREVVRLVRPAPGENR